MARRVVSSSSRNEPGTRRTGIRRRADSLSARELEVAGFLGADLSYRGIGIRLGISPETVRIHARNIFQKIGVRSRHAAVAQLIVGGVRVTRPGY